MRSKKTFPTVPGLLWILGSLILPGAVAAGSQPFALAEPGSVFVDYTKYGKFIGMGTADYHYVVTDKAGLAKALGEGLYPNTDGLSKDPTYIKLKGGLDIPQEKFGLWAGDPSDARSNFYRWASSDQDPASRLFFAAESFKDAKMWVQAMKAYYAVMVQFPTAARKNSDDSWSWSASLAQKARDKILFIIHQHPELGVDFVASDIQIENVGADNQKIVRLNPGYFIKAPVDPPVRMTDIVRTKGTGKVKLLEYANHHWVMTVDDKPYFIKGLCYDATTIGQSPDLKNMVGFPDLDDPPGVFDSWVAKKGVDGDQKPVGDPALLKNMGCNTIRLYYGAKSKSSLDKFCKESGVKVAMGVAFGAYALDSGSTWEKGTDYTDPVQQDHILKVLKDVVLQYKDEPYILCWVLGNENNYGVANNANKYPATYCDLVERACRMVHELDPNHPVAACMGETGMLDKMDQFAPDLDIVALNAYRGSEGFGNIWEDVRKKTDRPVFISEFGCPAFFNGKGEDEEGQAHYLEGAWKDIEYNRGGGPGVGNDLGGFVFEWMDEWWKAGAWKPPSQHDTSKGQWQGPFPDGWGHEEWFGIVSQGDGKHSPYLRQLRKSYWVLKDLWTKN